uniref:CSON012066 protein n=1 Tax=Culicoides sonorensis TaxID=179676 RepID=A0A336LGR9_CULSO
MPMKKFQGSPSVRVPDRLCDDCMGKLLIASDIADKASTAYEYFHTKLESGDILTISQNLCCVCLTEFNDENEITRMSNITESYFHLIASRNSKFKDELNFEKQICLKCVHDLELTNAIRYKNWKSEKVLELQFGGAKKSSSSTDNQIWIWDNDTDSDDCSEEPRDFTSRSLNPKLSQVADCQYCLAQFPSESSLRTHLHDAHIPISSECVQCGLKLVSERGAKLHYLSVHMRFVEAICDICGRTYHSQNKLNKHRIIHFEDRNVPCPLCPAKFKRKDNLKIHLRVHSGEKPFKCSYCEKRYAHHTDLKRHTFTHTSQYPFICKFCKAGFCKKAELKAHEEEHNPFDPNRKIKEAQIEYKEK